MFEKRAVEPLNRFFVSAYKLLGFLLLGLILAGLFGYVLLQLFFIFNRSWAAPAVVSPTDDKVLALMARLTQETAERERVAAERKEAEAELVEAERVVATEREFQSRFAEVVRTERLAREREARRAAELKRELAQSGAGSGWMRERAAELYEVKLLDKEQLLGELSRAAEFAEREIELDNLLERTRREALGLKALEGDGRPTTPDGLALWKQRATSGLLHDNAERRRAVLAQRLEELDTALKRYDALLSRLRDSPYYAAAERGMTVAFVPYANRSAAETGTPLYACTAWLVFCRKVGELGRRLEGEVSLKHPVRSRLLRGELYEVRLNDESSAKEELLHLGGPPFLF